MDILWAGLLCIFLTYEKTSASDNVQCFGNITVMRITDSQGTIYSPSSDNFTTDDDVNCYWQLEPIAMDNYKTLLFVSKMTRTLPTLRLKEFRTDVSCNLSAKPCLSEYTYKGTTYRGDCVDSWFANWCKTEETETDYEWSYCVPCFSPDGFTKDLDENQGYCYDTCDDDQPKSADCDNINLNPPALIEYETTRYEVGTFSIMYTFQPCELVTSPATDTTLMTTGKDVTSSGKATKENGASQNPPTQTPGKDVTTSVNTTGKNEKMIEKAFNALYVAVPLIVLLILILAVIAIVLIRRKSRTASDKKVIYDKRESVEIDGDAVPGGLSGLQDRQNEEETGTVDNVLYGMNMEHNDNEAETVDNVLYGMDTGEREEVENVLYGTA